MRTANVIACDPDGVDCLVLEREYVLTLCIYILHWRHTMEFVYIGHYKLIIHTYLAVTGGGGDECRRLKLRLHLFRFVVNCCGFVDCTTNPQQIETDGV